MPITLYTKEDMDAVKRDGMVTEELAYISVTKTGFVDGACFTESPNAAEWVKEQERAGMTIKRLPRAEGKRVLGTQLENV